MREVSEFLIDQRSQFREGGIIPVTPMCQELGHSLLRDRRRIHNLLFIPYHPQKVSARGSVAEKISIQMITLIDLSRLWQWKAKTKSKKITT